MIFYRAIPDIWWQGQRYMTSNISLLSSPLLFLPFCLPRCCEHSQDLVDRVLILAWGVPVLMDAAVPAICAHRVWQGPSAECSNHEDFSIYLLVWEFTGLKSSYSHWRKQCWCVVCVLHHHKTQLVVTGLCVWNGCIKSIGLIKDATDSGIDAEALSCILC